MNIALCLEYRIGEAGGVSVLVSTLIRELAADHRIVLVSADDPTSIAASKVAGLVQKHILWSPLNDTRAAAETLADEMARAGVDLAHFHFGANFAWNNRLPARCPIPTLARRGVPVVTTIHMAVGLLHGYCGPQKPFLFKLGLLPFAWVNKLRVLGHVRREIAVSRQDYGRLRRWYWPVREKFSHIYHSRIQSAGDAPSQSARDRIILGVGHIAQRKGQQILAEAFALVAKKYPDWKLMLAGHAVEPACFRELERIAARTPGQIELTGPRDDTPELMRRAAIFVQPSFHEGLPLSLQEALHHGCACVATEIPGNTELVNAGRNGLLVPPGNVPAMASALEQLINDPRLREKISIAGAETVSSLGMTAARMAAKHREIYASILSQT